MFLLLRFESSLNRWDVSSPHWKSSPSCSATKCCRSVRRPLPDGLYWKYTIRGFLDGSTDLIEPCGSWSVFLTHLLAHILKLYVILTSRLILPTNYSDSSISIVMHTCQINPIWNDILKQILYSYNLYLITNRISLFLSKIADQISLWFQLFLKF